MSSGHSHFTEFHPSFSLHIFLVSLGNPDLSGVGPTRTAYRERFQLSVNSVHFGRLLMETWDGVEINNTVLALSRSRGRVHPGQGLGPGSATL